MADFKCKKCGSESYMLQQKGTSTGLYCAKCGFWHKWLGKDELRVYKAQEMTTAEKLYSNGYRKQSDTVKNFVDELKEDIERVIDGNRERMNKRSYSEELYQVSLGEVTGCQFIIDKINELAAKYGVEVEQ